MNTYLIQSQISILYISDVRFMPYGMIRGGKVHYRQGDRVNIPTPSHTAHFHTGIAEYYSVLHL